MARDGDGAEPRSGAEEERQRRESRSRSRLDPDLNSTPPTVPPHARHAAGAGRLAGRAGPRAAAGRVRRSANRTRRRPKRRPGKRRVPARNRGIRRAPTPAAGAGPTGADMLSIGALSSAAQGRVLLRARRLLREGRSRASRRQRVGGQGRRRARAAGAGRCRRYLPGGARRQGAGRLRHGAGAARQGRRNHPPSGPRSHLLGPEIRLAGRAGWRRQAHRRGPRPRRGGDARLGREERHRDSHEGSRTRAVWDACRQPEDRRRHLPPRHLAQSRPAAPYPRRAGQHGAGGGRQVALDGERGPLCAPEADRDALPQRARRRARKARLRRREDPCRRPVRDRGRAKRDHRGVLEPARRNRGGDGGARSGQFRRTIRAWPSARR